MLRKKGERVIIPEGRGGRRFEKERVSEKRSEEKKYRVARDERVQCSVRTVKAGDGLGKWIIGARGKTSRLPFEMQEPISSKTSNQRNVMRFTLRQVLR